jgi:hypothetical protein
VNFWSISVKSGKSQIDFMGYIFANLFWGQGKCKNLKAQNMQRVSVEMST